MFYCYNHIDIEVLHRRSNIRRTNSNITIFVLHILQTVEWKITRRKRDIEYVRDNRKAHSVDYECNLERLENDHQLMVDIFRGKCSANHRDRQTNFD